MSTYILVHGSWSGGWQWEDVATRLTAQGHRVLAPTLTGLGDRHHLADETTSLHTHVAEIADLVHREDSRDVVLVGHSYGGMVITGAAAAAPVRELVYLDAFLPRANESVWDIMPWQREAFEGLRLPDRPWLIAPVDFPAFFPELGTDFDVSRLTPMPIATLADAVGAAPEPGAVPATYIHATNYNDDSAARARADGMRVIDVDAGHMLLVTHPDLTSEILLELGADRQ